MPNRVQGQRGMILFIVLAIFFIVILIGNFTMDLIRSQSRLTHHNVSRIQAYYIAQAAVNMAFEHLRDEVWPEPSSGVTNSYTMCGNSTCDINTGSSYPDSIHLPLTIEVMGKGAGSEPCNPPAGSRVCIKVRADYSLESF